MDTQLKTPEEIKTGSPEQQIIDTFQTEKKRYEQATQTERGDILDIYNAYQGKMEDVITTPYDSKETIPKLRTEISYVKPFIFSGQPEIEVEGVGDEDKPVSKILEKMINYRISQSIPNAYEKIEDWVHQAVTFGTSLIKVVWRFETKIEGDAEVPVKDEPDLEVPNILDTFKNPMIPEVAGQTSIICRSVIPVNEVKNNPVYDFIGQDGKRNADKLEGKSNIKTNPYDSTSQFSSQALSNQEGVVEVYERLTKDRIQTIAEDKETLVLRDTENPFGYINLVKFVFEKNTIPNTFDGLGVGHNTLGLGKSYYKMFNQTLTNVKMTNNPMFLFAKGTRIDKKQLVSKPGGGIEVDTGGKPLREVIEPIIFPDIKQGAVELLNKIDDEHKRASGANDLLQGSASNDTLGQDQIAQTNISNRFELVVRRFKEALAEVARMIIDMELKNLQSPDASILRIFPQEIRMEIYQLLITEAPNVKFNVKIKGDTVIARNKQLESKRLVDLFDLAQNFLTDREKRAFLRRIAERQGETNIDEIIQEFNPLAQMQEQMAVMPQGTYNQPGKVQTPQGLNQQAYGG